MTNMSDTPLARLSARWRQMVALAIADGPTTLSDLAGHIARWAAVEMCADELDALQRHLLEQKDHEESLTRMVEADPLTLKTPRRPDR